MPKLSKRHIAAYVTDSVVRQLIEEYFTAKNILVSMFSEFRDLVAAIEKGDCVWTVLLTDFAFKDPLEAELHKKMSEIMADIHQVKIFQPMGSIEPGGASQVARGPRVIQFEYLYVKVKAGFSLSPKPERLFNSSGGNDPIGSSPCFLRAVEMARKVAPSAANILITGESGTGKEVFAQFIHRSSKRARGPFVAVNCASIPENLVESELFGHAKGSFTGALAAKVGLFEAAQDGTIFLDEIGDLPMPLQAKLLRVLQEKKIRPVGDNLARAINCRVITATNKDLEFEVDAQRFREDLFFRLNVINIVVPALKDRDEDIIILAKLFLQKFSAQNGGMVQALSAEAIQCLMDREWRGNVRELENVMERAVILALGTSIQAEGVELVSNRTQERTLDSLESTEPEFSFAHPAGLPSLKEVVDKYIEYAIAQNGGARDKAARAIGIDRKTLYRRLNH